MYPWYLCRYLVGIQLSLWGKVHREQMWQSYVYIFFQIKVRVVNSSYLFISVPCRPFAPNISISCSKHKWKRQHWSKTLNDMLKNILRMILKVVNSNYLFSVILCSSNPCLHGTCTDTASGFSCSCDERHTGAKCDQRTYT